MKFSYEGNDISLADRVPDIVIGICRPVGTDTREMLNCIVERLTLAQIEVRTIHMRDLIVETINEANPDVTQSEYGEHVSANERLYLMRAGNYLRSAISLDIVARLTIRQISRIRNDVYERALEGQKKGVAFLILNFMHPSEVAVFRNVYRQRFFLIAATENMNTRNNRLVDSQIGSQQEDEEDENEAKQLVRLLMKIDQGIKPTDKRLGIEKGALSVDKTFQEADLFIQVDSPNWRKQIYRFFDQIYGNPFGALLDDERGMGIAYLASHSSGSFGRLVGAALFTKEGYIGGIGWNDPPLPGGGTYDENAEPDYRDHAVGYDVSDKLRIEAVQEFIDKLCSVADWESDLEKIDEVYSAKAWLSKLAGEIRKISSPRHEVALALTQIPIFRETRLFNLIEFGRSIHAEMSAITQAVRGGYSTTDATLYVTTYPCHECVRNIIAAGISRIVYIEPYGKSMANVLYPYEIETYVGNGTRPPTGAKKVMFETYTGISPRRFDDLFSWVDRKNSLGKVSKGETPGAAVNWTLHSSSRLRESIAGYVDDEYIEVHLPQLDKTAHLSEFTLSRLLAEMRVSDDTSRQIKDTIELAKNAEKQPGDDAAQQSSLFDEEENVL